MKTCCQIYILSESKNNTKKEHIYITMTGKDMLQRSTACKHQHTHTQKKLAKRHLSTHPKNRNFATRNTALEREGLRQAE